MRRQLCICGRVVTETEKQEMCAVVKWWTEGGVWVKERERFPLQCWRWIPMLWGSDQSPGLLLSSCSSPFLHSSPRSLRPPPPTPTFLSLSSGPLSHLFLCSDTSPLPAFITSHLPLLPNSPSSSSGHFSPPSRPLNEFPLFALFTLTGWLRDDPHPSYLRASLSLSLSLALSLSAVCEGLCTFSGPAISK